MKKLQNNFTTPEQSKRLLTLGLPVDSADCFYTELPKYNGQFNGFSPKPSILYPDESFSKLKGYSRVPIYPCWSVGRLIELSSVCGNGYPALFMKQGEIIMEWFIKFVEEEVTNKVWDFSKLEE